MRRGCLSLAALSEKRSPVFASWLTNPSWQSCRVASSSRLWTESRVERPSHPEVNQRDALKKKLYITRGCFYRTVVEQNLAQWPHWNGVGFVRITSVYCCAPQDDKYGCVAGFIVKPQRNCPGAFWPARCTQGCLWKVFTRKEDSHIWTVLITLSRRSVQSGQQKATSPPAQASLCGSKYCGCQVWKLRH